MHSILNFMESNNVSCPNCACPEFTELNFKDSNKIECKNCKSVFLFMNNIPLLVKNTDKKEIQDFWSELYLSAYKEHENLDTKSLKEELYKLKELFIHRNHLATTEMPIDSLSGKNILEIGSGAGAHSSLFKLLGGQVKSIDITLNRVVSTSYKLDLLDELGPPSLVIQADSQSIPFSDNTFDIVYSNGVLHHTFDTNKAIDEAYRVLKPGGQIVIMLYSKSSFLYWVNIFLFKGILLGNIFRKNWIGRVTEWMSKEKQKKYNPVTKVFTRSELDKMFISFENVQIRKSSFQFNQIPLIGNYLRRKFNNGANTAGKLVYGENWLHETKFELSLGKFIGFDFNIKAYKPKNINEVES